MMLQRVLLQQLLVLTSLPLLSPQNEAHPLGLAIGSLALQASRPGQHHTPGLTDGCLVPGNDPQVPQVSS